MQYWLMKSEPDVFGVEQLAAAPRRTTCWDGVRNYQVRNMLRDQVRRGDQAFLYHSSCAEPGIVAILEIVRAGYPDPTAPKEEGEARWYAVDVRLERRLARIITLAELRARARRELKDMLLLRRGNRLSITPVSAAEWRCVLALERAAKA